MPNTNFEIVSADQAWPYSSYTTRLVVQHGGNVGIGTSTPDATLDVNGNVAVAGNEVINSAGQWVGDPTGLIGGRVRRENVARKVLPAPEAKLVQRELKAHRDKLVQRELKVRKVSKVRKRTTRPSGRTRSGRSRWCIN